MSNAALREAQAYRSYIGSTVRMTIDGTSRSTNGINGNPSPLVQLARYRLCPIGAAIYFRQGGPGVAANDDPNVLAPGEEFFFNTTDLTDNRLALMTADGNGGTAYLTRVDALTGIAPGNAQVQRAQAFMQFIGPTTKLAAGVVSVVSSALVHGARYLAICPVIDPSGLNAQAGDDIWIRQGGTGLTVSSTTGMPLAAGRPFYFNVDDGSSDRIAVLSATGGNNSFVFVTRVDQA